MLGSQRQLFSDDGDALSSIIRRARKMSLAKACCINMTLLLFFVSLTFLVFSLDFTTGSSGLPPPTITEEDDPNQRSVIEGSGSFPSDKIETSEDGGTRIYGDEEDQDVEAVSVDPEKNGHLEYVAEGMSEQDYVHNVLLVGNVTRMMTEEGLLKRWLFSHYGLHITDRPVLRYSDTVSVNLKFELLRFLHIDDLRGSMAVLGIVVLTWFNPFLVWQGKNITQSHITRIALKSGEVWTPLILHLNNVKELNVVDKYGRGRGNMVMELFDNGTQLWPPTGIYESSCDLNFTYFPLDRQTCTFVFESWLANSFVNISHATAIIHDERNFLSKSQIWQFKKLSATTQTINYDGNPYSQAWVVISMRRRHAYYTWNILIPCASLSLLQLSTFALPPETPERASFSVTVLVAFGILQTIIKAEIPTTSDTVLLVIYVVGQLSIGTLATFYIVVSVGLASYSFPQLPASRFKHRITRNRRPPSDSNSMATEPIAPPPDVAVVTSSADAVAPTDIGQRRRRSPASKAEPDRFSQVDEDSPFENWVDPRRLGHRFFDILFFQRPVLNQKSIRIMDAIAFSVLVVLTVIGHITVYALLHAAAVEDDDDHLFS